MLPLSTTNTDYSLSSSPFVCLSAACQLHFSHDAGGVSRFRFVFGGRSPRNAFCVSASFCSFIARGGRREKEGQRCDCDCDVNVDSAAHACLRVLCFICLALILSSVGGSTATECEMTPQWPFVAHTDTHTYMHSLLQLKVLSAACHHYQQQQHNNRQ